MLLSDIQFLRLHQAFSINSSANIKLSKNQLSKMVQLSGGFLFSLHPLLANQENLVISAPKTKKDSLENKGPPKSKKIFKRFL